MNPPFLKIQIKPWVTPNFIVCYSPDYSLPLSEVEPDTLSDMCDNFRKEVFAKAKQKDPKCVS